MDGFILKMDDVFPSKFQQYLDYPEREEGDKGTLGMWPELWHEKGWADGYDPPSQSGGGPEAGPGRQG